MTASTPTQPAGGVLQGIVDLAIEAHAHWDADRDAKVGKILLALAGVSPRYDRRADALHAALASEGGELCRTPPAPVPADPVAAWQPIETAPKDGSHVLVVIGSTAVAAYCDDERGDWWEVNTHWTDATGMQIYPTLWQPMPAAPLHAEGGE